MKIVISPDSFKESLEAIQVCRAIEAGVRRVWPDSLCVSLPVADGGEGTNAVLIRSGSFRSVSVHTHDALMRPSTSTIAWNPDKEIAVVEVAEACGLEQVPKDQRDIWAATSYGVGECLEAALGLGAKTVIIALGGSATNDAGCGMLTALGMKTESRKGEIEALCPADLVDVESIDISRFNSRWNGVQVIIATDVMNPLTGPQGASEIFAPQKGASKEDVSSLDLLHRKFASLCERATGYDASQDAGAGAAGGIGFAALSLLHATVVPGISMVIDLIGLAHACTDADLIITGEGCVDAQTAMGKAPWGVLQVGIKAQVPVIILAGTRGEGADLLTAEGATAVVPIVQGPVDLEEALAHASENLTSAAEMTCRLASLGLS